MSVTISGCFRTIQNDYLSRQLTEDLPVSRGQQRRRALELLAGSRDGCTEAIMLAHGFKTEFLIDLINARLANAQTERMLADGRGSKSSGFESPRLVDVHFRISDGPDP